MKRLLLPLFLLITTFCYADQPRTSNAPLQICTIGTTNCTFPYQVNVTTGTITDFGNGKINIATGGSGGAGTPGGSPTQLQYNSAGTFAGVTGSGVDSNGNIGVGTSVPLDQLDVTSSTSGLGATIGFLASGIGGCDSNNKLLLHLDTDRSDSECGGSAKTATNTGTTIDSTIKEFGAGSGAFNSSSYFTFPDNADWNYGTGDFIIKVWVYYSSTAGNQAIYSQGTDGNNFLSIYMGSSLITLEEQVAGSYTNGFLLTAPFTPSTSTWYYIQINRISGVVHIFTGIAGGTATSQTVTTSGGNQANAIPDFTGALTIGAAFSGSVQFHNGNMDEYLISKGGIGDSSNFGVPSGPFTSALGKPTLTLRSGTTKYWSIGEDDTDSNKLKIGTTAIGTNTRMTIDSTGNVGIASVTPGTKLDVIGTVRATNFVVGTNSLIKGGTLTDTKFCTYTSATDLVSCTSTGGSGTPGGGLNAVAYNSPIGTFAGDETKFSFNGTNIGIGTSNATKNSLDVRTDATFSGNVGIGTTLTTTSALTVMNGNVGIGTWKPNVLFTVARGNVGIGTLTSGATFQISTDEGAGNDSDKPFRVFAGKYDREWYSDQTGVVTAPNGFVSVLGFTISGGNNIAYTPTNIYFSTNGSTNSDIGLLRIVPNVMRVTKANAGGYGTLESGQFIVGSNYGGSAIPADGMLVQGNVGIGTITTINKLSVAGNIGIGTNLNSNYLRSAAPTGGAIFEGNVGIGTHTPNSPLEIRGASGVTVGSVKTGANTACTTTCGTSACLFGEDTSVVGTIVACTDATADICVCLGR